MEHLAGLLIRDINIPPIIITDITTPLRISRRSGIPIVRPGTSNSLGLVVD